MSADAFRRISEIPGHTSPAYSEISGTMLYFTTPPQMGSLASSRTKRFGAPRITVQTMSRSYPLVNYDLQDVHYTTGIH